MGISAELALVTHVHSVELANFCLEKKVGLLHPSERSGALLLTVELMLNARGQGGCHHNRQAAVLDVLTVQKIN